MIFAKSHDANGPTIPCRWPPPEVRLNDYERTGHRIGKAGRFIKNAMPTSTRRYSCGNDLSVRDCQRPEGCHWVLKSFAARAARAVIVTGQLSTHSSHSTRLNGKRCMTDTSEIIFNATTDLVHLTVRNPAGALTTPEPAGVGATARRRVAQGWLQ